ASRRVEAKLRPPAQCLLLLAGCDPLVVLEALAIWLLGDDAGIGGDRLVEEYAVDGEDDGEEAHHQQEDVPAGEAVLHRWSGKHGSLLLVSAPEPRRGFETSFAAPWPSPMRPSL